MTEYSTAELAGFRIAQRIAYAATASVETTLRAGVTERDVATLLHARLAEAGVRRYFHGPLVWFGDRTVLGDAWPSDDYLPTSRELQPGMPVILDVAPIVDGYVADVAYAFAFGDNIEMGLMLGGLANGPAAGGPEDVGGGGEENAPKLGGMPPALADSRYPPALSPAEPPSLPLMMVPSSPGVPDCIS